VQSTNLGRVILWMTGTLLSFCVLAISVRGLAGALNLFEILTVRSFISLLVIFAVMAAQPQVRAGLAARRLGVHFTRSVLHFGAQWLWVLGLTMLPLATVFALEFTMPAWTTLLAAIFLAERLTPSRIGVILLGIVGVLVILRPGLEIVQPAAFYVLLAAFGYATTMILTKQLTATESTLSILFWMSLMQLPMGLLGADSLTFPLKLESHHILAAVGLGVASLSAHFCLANAMRAGEASVVVPIDFLRIPLIALVGWWLYQESIDLFVFLGAGIIVLGVLWNLRAESRRFPAPAAAAPQMADASRRQ